MQNKLQVSLAVTSQIYCEPPGQVSVCSDIVFCTDICFLGLCHSNFGGDVSNNVVRCIQNGQESYPGTNPSPHDKASPTWT